MKIPVEVALSEDAVDLLRSLRMGAAAPLKPDEVYTELAMTGLMYRTRAIGGFTLSPIGEQIADFYLSLPF